MSILSFFVNSILCFSYKKKYNRFINCTSIEKAQKDKLFSILLNNRESQYGKEHDFSSISSTKEFQEKLPLTTYEDYLPYIDRIVQEGSPSLYSEPTLLLEKSSGSSSASKYIPYTAGLKEEFDHGIAPWYYNLYTRYPALKWGKSYWSITPAGSIKEYTPSGIPIGFESDSGYLGKLASKLQPLLFAVPNYVAKFTDMEDFRFITCQALLKCRNLRLLSVWNPTFFLLLLDYMTENANTLTKNKSLQENLVHRNYKNIWKKLSLISCWSSGNAAQYAEKLSNYFPNAILQPKGLIATECFVSFPLANENGSRLSIFSHFFEFIDTKTEHLYLAHELQKGRTYRVVVTTSGGLYRYQLGDIVEVLSAKGIPRIEFLGRGDKVSDLFGEKLNEQFVQNSIESLLSKQEIKVAFYMLAPEQDHYTLYIKSDSALTGLDQALCENFHYHYCRELQQLKPATIKYVTGKPENAYLNECVRRGQKLGDIKPTALHLQGGWDTVFTGRDII